MGTILRETDKSIVLSVTDPTWAAADESVLQTQLGMVTVSKVTQGDVSPGTTFCLTTCVVVLSMMMLP